MTLNRAVYRFIGELYQIKTNDGITLNLTGLVWLRGFGNFGLADFEYQTRNAYKQDGSTEIDFKASERQFNVTIYRTGLATRTEYWNERQRLINVFRPNRGGLLTMTVINEAEQKRSILCRVNGGVEFSNESANDNNWDLELNLSLIAFNPTWFDSDATLFNPDATEDNQLVFPITFDDDNIFFGTSGQVYTTGDITYNGNWKAYPLMTITGPYTSATLTNTANNVEIQLLTPIASGEQRIINTQPGEISLVDANDVSKFDELAKDANFVDFSILPESEFPNGVTAQQILARVTGATVGQTAFSVQYNERYIGI